MKEPEHNEESCEDLNDEDSNEARVLVDKGEEEIKLRKLMK